MRQFAALLGYKVEYIPMYKDMTLRDLFKRRTTDNEGNTISQKSAGELGFKGARKSTPYAASQVAETASRQARELGVREVSIIVKGAGGGRISAMKSIKVGGLNVISIKDATPIPHNGCRPKKRRRA